MGESGRADRTVSNSLMGCMLEWDSVGLASWGKGGNLSLRLRIIGAMFVEGILPLRVCMSLLIEVDKEWKEIKTRDARLRSSWED